MIYTAHIEKLKDRTFGTITAMNHHNFGHRIMAQ